MDEPIEMPFEQQARVGPRNRRGAHWRHLANTMDRFVLICVTCRYHYCSNLVTVGGRSHPSPPPQVVGVCVFLPHDAMHARY